MRKPETKTVEKINWPITVLLMIGCVTILFPLYMAVVIALKNPTEMTNDIAGILSLPKQFSLSNFAEAMRVTDFWHSLGNSLFITGTVILLSVIIHSLPAMPSAATWPAANFITWLIYTLSAVCSCPLPS